jgi:redox-sensitive bicupin YhaK (pirin superfamily)
MMGVREIRRIVSGSIQYDGAGVKLVRVIGHKDVRDFDPFLMLDAFDSDDPADYIKGFPWHPHRGIETVTYLIAGDIEHGDSIGNKGHIVNGCCQWMTAGSGIIHQEMPQSLERMLGIQLWLNLPRKDKMARPQYRDIQSDRVPCVEENGSQIRVISGNYLNHPGVVQGDYVRTLFLDVKMRPDAKWSLKTAEDATVFLYIIEGSGWFGNGIHDPVISKNAILFGPGEELTVEAADQGIRFLIFSGKPLQEPVAWGGPIVMNTQDELRLAFRELEEGTFIKEQIGLSG